MCLVFIAHKAHPDYKLIVAANRDEFYARKTSPADFWSDQPHVLAGRDLEALGTWMGVSRYGKVSLVTNYRDLKNIRANAPSRGHLVSDFLTNGDEPLPYMQQVQQHGSRYNGFNLISGNVDQLWYYSNYENNLRKLEPGLFGLSNHLLNTEWPKVRAGMEQIRNLISTGNPDSETLFAIMRNDATAPDDELPDTGVGLEMERMLSSMFIKSPNYGSRSTTVLLVDNEDRVSFQERTYEPGTLDYTTRIFEFMLEKPVSNS